MGETIAEKIISAHAGRPVYRGEIAIVTVDGAMATDATGPLAIRAFREMGGRALWRAEGFALVIDHAAPAPNEQVANLHRLMRDFAREMGCRLYDVGEGICHQLMVEHGHVRPGELFVGAEAPTATSAAVWATPTPRSTWARRRSWLPRPCAARSPTLRERRETQDREIGAM